MTQTQTHVDRYEVQDVIGRGAMGVVYRALDPVIGRVVALKMIHRPDEGQGPVRPESAERFSREARAAGLLSHPNIVTIYDVGGLEGGSLSYIAMEYVEGRTLRQMVPHGTAMAAGEVLDIAIQVARALDYAHRRGIIHRDVKPANILIRDDGLVKLADFGVALIESSDLTRTGQSVGSPSYIAPEVLLDQPPDGRADLFSLGVIVYELLTGAKPFQGETLAALYHRVIAVDPDVPSRVNPAVPSDWDSIVMKLLAKEPDRRYADAAALIEDLRAIETGRTLTDSSRPEIPDVDLDRVIEQGAADSSGSRPVRHVPPHSKAFFALAAIAVFALAIILSAAFLRQAGGTPATGAGAAADAAAPAPAPVDLTVRLAHNLKAGRLRIAMDEKELVVEPFQGERTRMRMQGTLWRRLEIPEGKHLFRVAVEEEGGRKWSAVTTRDLEEGSEATLFVEVKGLLKKELALTWY